ncbi:MAG: PEP-CTERM sorting domain-containing protein [Phycisphaerae bacterium]
MRNCAKSPHGLFFCRHPLIKFFGIGAFVICLVWSSPAKATPINFFVYENSSQADVSQLDNWVDVQDGGSYADFTFYNDSSISSVITAVYFEATAFSSTSLINGTVVTPQPSGVKFSPGANPSKPAGSIKNFGGTWNGTLLSAGADAPSPTWGLSSGESLTIRFDYNGINYSDLIEAFSDPAKFRIAEHIPCLPNDNSVWSMNSAQVYIPLPSTLALFGLGFLGMLRRRIIRT